MFIKKLLEALSDQSQLLNAIRLCEKQLPNDRFRAAVKTILAIYDRDFSAYEDCLNELKRVSNYKERSHVQEKEK